MPRQPLNQDDARFRLAMAAVVDGMAIVGSDGRWQDVNPALCRMLGVDADALHGRPMLDAIDPADQPSFSRAFAGVRDDGTSATGIALRCLRGEGTVVPVHVALAPMRDEATAAGAVVVQLRVLDAEPVGDACRTQLEAAQRSLAAIAYGVSHDLRAPLRTIEGFAQQLLRQAPDLDEGAARSLDRIRGATAHMGRLIESLLEMSRIARARLQPVDADMSLLAEWAAAELQDARPGQAVELQVQDGLAVRGDEQMLKSLLSLLLRNAWQFAKPGEPVRVEVSGTCDDGGLHLVVRDHGIGFDMAYADKLFEPFQRLHGTEEGAGDGIGLAIVREVAARHGGEVWAEARPGEGAAFHVKLRDVGFEETVKA